MTDSLKTVCVGRVLIDVPREAVVSYRTALVSGWFIDTVEESKEDFVENLDEKETELSLLTNERDLPSLERVRKISIPQGEGKIFVYNRKWTDWFEGEKQVFADFAEVLAAIHINGVTHIFSSQNGDHRIRQLEQIIQQIRPRAADHIPAQAGLCLDRAILEDPPLSKQTETVVAFLHFADHPDFRIAFRNSGGLKPSPPLFSRVADIDSEVAARRLVLRREARKIDKFTGQEFVEKYFELNGASTHNFTWESFSDPGNLLQPELKFELSTGISPRPGGKPVDASLSDLALLQLWDDMLDSIRLRPVNAQKP